MFLLNFTVTFNSHREKVVGNNEVLNKRLKTTLQKLALNPIHPSVHSHKVNTLSFGQR